MLSRTALYLTVPAGIAAAALLVLTAVSLVRTVRRAVVTRIPFAAEQRVALPAPGDYTLSLEGAAFHGLPSARWTLARSTDAAAVPLRPVVFRTEVSSVSRARVELYRFTAPSAGDYVLRASLEPGADTGSTAIVIARPYRGLLVVHVLALIALGAAAVGSLVASGLAIAGPSGETAIAGAPASLEGIIAQAAAVVRARTRIEHGRPRYQVLETCKGVVPSAIAGAADSSGLLLDTQRAQREGYFPIDGEEVVVALAAPAIDPAAPPAVVLGEPTAILTVREGIATSHAGGAVQPRTLTLEELRAICAR